MNNRVPIETQITALATALGLNPDSALAYASALPNCPDCAEGWFAIPSVEALTAKHFPEVTDPAERYCQAVRLVMSQVGKTDPLKGDYREDFIVPARLRQNERAVQSLETVAQSQRGDILVVAAQTGWYQRGKSAHWARQSLAENEFGLDTVALGALALTHPDPYTWWKQRSVNCLGDELDPGAQGNYSHVPIFVFMKNIGVWYGARPTGASCIDGGSATGFISR